jgi:WhiB family transcriptional regulator, redox-sensing transcriptional regulator
VRDDRWQEQAACRGVDVELFFSVEEADVALALSYCDRCPVRPQCLAHAMTDREAFGVWGGMRENERRRIFRSQRRRRDTAA